MSVSLPPPTEPLVSNNQINEIWYRSLWQKLNDVDSKIASCQSLIVSGSASSAATLDIDLSSTLYRAFNVKVEVNLSTVANLLIRYSNNGSTFNTNSVYSYSIYHVENGLASGAGSTAAAAGSIVNALNVNKIAHLDGTFYSPTASYAHGSYWYGFVTDGGASGYVNSFHSANSLRTTYDIAAMRILPDAGQINTIKYAVYGLP